MRPALTRAEITSYASIFGIYIVLTCAYALMGPIPNIGIGADIVYTLDWVSRIDQGQIPHNDFHNFVGAGFLYMCWFFMKLAHFSIAGLSLANMCVTGAAFGLACGLIALARVTSAAKPSLPATLMMLFAILSYGYGTYVLGYDGAISYTNLYNRWGYALLAVVFLQIMVLRETTIPAALAIGIVIGALFLIKSTYAYVGIGLLILGTIMGYERRPTRILTTLGAAILTVSAFLAASGIDFSAMTQDYATPMKVRIPLLMQHLDFLASKLIGSSYNFVLIGVLVTLLALHIKKRVLRETFCFLALVAMAILLQLTNYGSMDSPMAIMVVCFSVFALDLLDGSPVLAVAILTLVCGCFYAKNAASFAEAGMMAYHRDTYPEWHLGPYTNIRVFEVKKGYYAEITEGLDLLREHVAKPEKIAALSFENPFNTALNVAAPRYLPTVWDFGMSFSETNYPDFRTTFADTSYIMAEKDNGGGGDWLMRIYHDDLDRDFQKIAESPSWILMQRK